VPVEDVCGLGYRHSNTVRSNDITKIMTGLKRIFGFFVPKNSKTLLLPEEIAHNIRLHDYLLARGHRWMNVVDDNVSPILSWMRCTNRHFIG
jgi:hypothetical protein